MDAKHQYNQSVLDLSIKAGEILLNNGAEIFRVQETMEHISRAYQIYSLQVFVIANGIFVTIHEKDYDRSTEVKHIPLSTVHIGRITAVNQLSREITEGLYSIEEASLRLDKIKELPFFPKWLRTIATSVGSACFCYMLGGSIFDSVVSALAGTVMYLFHLSKKTQTLSKVLKKILESMVVSFVSILFYSIGFGDNIDHIIIGSIIPLVPGVALTTSVRDFFNGDYLSGTIHITDTLLVALSISIGVGSSYQFFQYLGLLT